VFFVFVFFGGGCGFFWCCFWCGCVWVVGWFFLGLGWAFLGAGLACLPPSASLCQPQPELVTVNSISIPLMDLSSDSVYPFISVVPIAQIFLEPVKLRCVALWPFLVLFFSML